MTNATRAAAFVCVALGAGVGHAPQAAGGPLLSNDIQQLAGDADTVWLATASGLNFTIDTLDTTPNWWGHGTKRAPWSLALGGGMALAGTDAGTDNASARFSFVTYHYRGDSLATYTLTWNHDNFRQYDSLQPVFVGYGAAWADSAWWLACVDGGLVRWTPTLTKVAGPGKNHTLYSLSGYPDASLAGTFGTPTVRPVGVAAAWAQADSAKLWVATPGRVWTFTPRDTSWDTLSTQFGGGAGLVEYLAVYVNSAAAPPRVYAVVAVKPNARDTSVCLYKYESGSWVYVYGRDTNQKPPRGVTFASDRYLYVLDSTQLTLLVDSTTGSPPVIGRPQDFQGRFLAASSDVSWDILRFQDVLATTDSRGGYKLWVASSQGLFYTRGEKPWAASTAPFHFVRRTLGLDAGVDHVRAYPTVLNVTTPDQRVNFAYRLAKDDHVTIRIYDFNMDLVKTVVAGVQRRGKPAGETSNDPSADYWNGTNEAGRVVAPGLYYYKMSTNTGGHAFGKIVVALPR